MGGGFSIGTTGGKSHERGGWSRQRHLAYVGHGHGLTAWHGGYDTDDQIVVPIEPHLLGRSAVGQGVDLGGDTVDGFRARRFELTLGDSRKQFGGSVEWVTPVALKGSRAALDRLHAGVPRPAFA